MKSLLYSDIVHFPTPKPGDHVLIFLKERYGVDANNDYVLLDRNTWVNAEVFSVNDDGTFRVTHVDWNVPMRNSRKIIRNVNLNEIRSSF